MYRQNAKISALSSGKLGKYEHLTGEDLGYRPDPVEKAKFEYSPLGQVFNKGLNADEKKEGLLKRLKNIEDKTDNQLLAIKDNKDNQLGIKSIGYEIKKKIPPEGITLFRENVNKEKSIKYKYLDMWGGNKVHYDFRTFKSLKELFNSIYFGEILIPAVEREENAFDHGIEELKKYRARGENYIQQRSDLLTNAPNVYDGREMIINGFNYLEIIMKNLRKNHQKV